jgi:hypothetical protein
MSLEALFAKISGQNGNPEPNSKPVLITEDMLDDLFTFHTWSPDQVQKGQAIRAAAKELVRMQMREQEATIAFLRAIEDSAPAPLGENENPSRLQLLAAQRRAAAVEVARNWNNPEHPAKVAELVNKVVMQANSAITFEAAAPDLAAV